MKKYITIFLGIILIFIIPLGRVNASGVSLVQKNFQTIRGSTNSLSFSTNVTASDLINVSITQFSTTVVSVNDNKNDTFSQVAVKHANSSTDYAEMYYAKNVAGGSTTITVTFSGLGDSNVGIYEYSGLDTVLPLDQVTSATGRSSSPNGGSLITTTDNEAYVVVGVDDFGNNTTANAGSGYILENHEDDSNTHERYYLEDRISPHGSYSTNFTIGTSSNWAVIGASFKPTTGQTPTPTPTSAITLTPTPTSTITLTPTPTPTGIPNSPAHIVIVPEENHQLQQVLPVDYFTYLASQGALMVNSFGVTHPSAPNYFALFSGSQQGVTDDTCPPINSPFSTSNLASQLASKSLTFIGYYEQPSVNCVSTFAWKWFSNVPSGDSQLFSAFPTNYANLPTVSWVLPNLQDNAHDGTLQQASNWLKTNIEGYRAWAMQNNSILIVTFDEDDNNENNHIYTVWIGQHIMPGIYNENINHYNMLSTIEDLYGMPHLANASGITDIFK